MSDTNESNDAAVELTQDVDGIPYCRKHHCRMKQASGGRKESATVYYACPVHKCGEKAQKIKTTNQAIVPARPLACPRCAGRSSKSTKAVFCEREDSRSNAASVVLRCPSCGWRTGPLVVPTLAAFHLEHRPRRPEPGLGDR